MRLKRPVLLLAGSLFLISCGSEKPADIPKVEAQAEAETKVESSGIAITAAQTSPHFQTVLERLDVGGKSLQFEDHEGSRELWTGLLGLLLNFSDDIGLPEGLDVDTMVDASGLASAAASGRSVVKDGDGWLVRHYAHHPDGLSGATRLLGDAMELQMTSTLPEATDLALELRINLSHLPETLRKISGSSELADMLEEYLQTELPIGMKMGEVIGLADLHILAGLELMDAESSEMPMMPKSWVLKLGINPRLVSACLDLMNEALGEPAREGNEQRWLLPMPGMAGGQPMLVLRDGDTLILVSDLLYYESMKSGGGTLADNAVYQAATNHFPQSGNFQAYLAPGVDRAILSQWLIAMADYEEDMIPFAQTLTQLLPSNPWSISIACEGAGVSTLMEVPFAFDGNSTAALAMMSMSSTLFVGARAWKTGSDRAACIMNTRNVQQAIRGHQNMYNLPIGTPINWDEIFGPNGYMKEPVCPLGGTYTFATTIPEVGSLACICSIPEHQMDPDDVKDW